MLCVGHSLRIVLISVECGGALCPLNFIRPSESETKGATQIKIKDREAQNSRLNARSASLACALNIT